MSFSELTFLQYVNAANIAVYRCGIPPAFTSSVVANSFPPSELDIQTALISISDLYTYMTNNTPATNSFTPAQYQNFQNLLTYLNMPVNRNGPSIVLGANKASSLGALANNYLTRPIETVGYFAQTACVDFALRANPPVPCNGTNQPPCTFANALSVFSNAYADMCKPNIQSTMDNLYLALMTYNASYPSKFFAVNLPGVASAITAFVSAAEGATDGYLSVLKTYLTTSITAGTSGSLDSLAASDLNGLALALYELGEQNPISITNPNGGGALKGMIKVCAGDTLAKNSIFSGEYTNVSYCPAPRNCWFNDLDQKWHKPDQDSTIC